MKAATVFVICALLLYLIFSGFAERLWSAITSNGSTGMAAA